MKGWPGKEKREASCIKLDLIWRKDLVSDGCGGETILSSQQHFLKMSQQQLKCIILHSNKDIKETQWRD